MKKIKIPSLGFLVLFAVVMTAFNYQFFYNAFKHIDFTQSPFFAISMPIAMFVIFLLFAAIFLLPFVAKPITLFLIAVTVVSAYFIQAYGIIIDKDMIFNAVNTDIEEVKNLITFKMIVWILLFFVFAFALIFMVKISYSNFSREILKRAILSLICIIILGSIYLTFNKSYVPFFRQNKKASWYIIPTKQLGAAYKVYKRLVLEKKEFKIVGDDATYKKGKKKRILVFIIGETQRTANYSLNGYSVNETNPYLSKQENLVSLKNFYSCATSTRLSVPCLLTNFNRDNFDVDEANNMSNFADILQKIGINVIWLDNNSGGCTHLCDRIKKENKKLYYARGLDEKIYKEAKTAIKNAKDDTLIILHIQGSHGPAYYKNYPKNFKKFTPTCDTAQLEKCDMQTIANTYDNTILYQDYLQNSLINELKGKNENFQKAFIFVSDHGESLGENGLYLHGMPYALAPTQQKHIPAIFWFDESKKELAYSLKNMQDREFSHDNIFHSVLGFFEVKTKLYNKKLDIFSIAEQNSK